MSALSLLVSHARLVFVALSLALMLGLSVGLASRRRPRLAQLLLGSSALVQTIPAIALLAVMVPFLAWLAARTGAAIPSIGALPALIALTAYALLPIVRGVTGGLASIDPSVRIAAQAVGMTERQALLRVELPLATPSILAGLRTASVWTVGMATLATPVGGRSLGNLIFSGLQTRHFDDVLLGCGAAAALAMVIDLSLAGMEARSRGRHALSSLSLVLGTTLVLGLVLAIVRDPSSSPLRAGAGSSHRVLAVGAKSFTEQLILAEILRCALAPADVQVHPSLGTTVAFDALVAGDLDVYVEYTGTAWTTLLGHTDSLPRAAMEQQVIDELHRVHHVSVAARLGFENAYAVVVRGDDPSTGIGELAAREPLRFGGDYEFFSRDEWRALDASYGLGGAETVTMDPSLLYEALRAGSVDAIAGYTTEGRINAFALRVLPDERGALPPYDAMVLVSDRFVREEPEAMAALERLNETIDDAMMRRLNAAVDSQEHSPEEAASEHPSCASPTR